MTEKKIIVDGHDIKYEKNLYIRKTEYAYHLNRLEKNTSHIQFNKQSVNSFPLFFYNHLILTSSSSHSLV